MAMWNDGLFFNTLFFLYLYISWNKIYMIIFFFSVFNKIIYCRGSPKNFLKLFFFNSAIVFFLIINSVVCNKNDRENTFLTDLAPGVIVWTGGNSQPRHDPAGTWHWTDGSVWSYTAWTFTYPQPDTHTPGPIALSKKMCFLISIYAVGAASQWWSNERMMVYLKLMMVKC